MSWSLQLRNGDLALSGVSLAKTTGAQKLVQDLRCALLEERGHDDAHPRFGSLLDGGIDEYGRYQASLIGSHDWDRIRVEVQTEIQRIIADHQQKQIRRSTVDRQTYGESTLTPDELLVSVAGIEMTQAADRLMVRVTLNTGRGSVEEIDIPITNAPVI